MLKEIFSNRLFIGALVFFILCVVGGTLYIGYVEQQGAKELAEAEERIRQLTEKQQQSPAKAPVGDTSQGGHWHGDEWHADPHEPVEPPTEIEKQPAAPDITELSKLPDDIDPDDIPAFSITGPMGEVYNYDRPLTPEEREMYYKLKADISYWNATPAGIKMSAIILVRSQKVKEGALHPFFEDWGKGILTTEELEHKIAGFYEMSR